MEKLPYPAIAEVDSAAPVAQPADPAPDTKSDWRQGLPTLTGSLVTLRELRGYDARPLFVALTSDEVTRYIAPPPATVEAFARFIAWSRRQRVAGQYVSFAIVPNGSDEPIGVFQVRSLEPAFGTAEWGFAMASEFWGTGVFADAARLVMAFAFDTLGAHRLEARGSLANGRGSAALRKLGATREGVLRKSFLCRGEHHDQELWTMLADDWRDVHRGSGSPRIH